MFAECGIEVYEAIGTVWVEEGSGQNVMRTNIVVRTRERGLRRYNNSYIQHLS